MKWIFLIFFFTSFYLCDSFPCNCSNHGQCMNNDFTYCNCQERYTTYPKQSKKQCNYKKKDRLVAFGLHFMCGLPFGIGEYYLENKQIGTIQLLLFWPTQILFKLIDYIILSHSTFITSSNWNNWKNWLFTYYTYMILFIWLIDLLLILFGYRKDGYDINTFFWGISKKQLFQLLPK